MLVCRVSGLFFPDGPSSGTTIVCSPMIGLEGSKIKAIKISKGIFEMVLAKLRGALKGMALNLHFLVT